jgi:hypothetical protein
MKKLFVGVPLLLASAAVWAIPFQGTYDVSVNTGGSGLQVNANPSSGALLFDLDVGQSVWQFLFSISTNETTVNNDDRIPVAASIDFDFVLPTVFSGTSNGDTEGISLWSGLVQAGVLTWDNGGVNSLYFGDGGVLDVYLEDAVFGLGLLGLSHQTADVSAKFTYRRGTLAVPEPAILTLVGGGLLLLALIRRRRSAAQKRENDHS